MLFRMAKKNADKSFKSEKNSEKFFSQNRFTETSVLFYTTHLYHNRCGTPGKMQKSDRISPCRLKKNFFVHSIKPGKIACNPERF